MFSPRHQARIHLMVMFKIIKTDLFLDKFSMTSLGEFKNGTGELGTCIIKMK